MTPYGPGRFSAQLHLFIDDDGVRELVLIVSGEGVAREGKASEGEK